MDVNVGVILCIAAVDIFSRRVSRYGQSAVRYHLPLLGDVVLAIFYSVDLTERYLIEVYHFATYMSRSRFFLKHKSTAWDAMAEREGLHAHRPVFIDDLCASMREGMKLHFIGYPFAEEFEMRSHQRLQFGEGVNVQRSRAPEQSKG